LILLINDDIYKIFNGERWGPLRKKLRKGDRRWKCYLYHFDNYNMDELMRNIRTLNYWENIELVMKQRILRKANKRKIRRMWGTWSKTFYWQYCLLLLHMCYVAYTRDLCAQAQPSIIEPDTQPSNFVVWVTNSSDNKYETATFIVLTRPNKFQGR
jgi:hypothetical protein